MSAQEGHRRTGPGFAGRGVLLPVVTFLFLMSLFYGFVHTPTSEGAWFAPHCELLARIVGSVLRLAGQSVAVNGTIIEAAGFELEISRGCDAIEAMAAFVAAVLASPTVWGRKPLGIVLGLSALWVMNVARILTLYVIRLWYPRAFDLVHEGFWQVVMVFLAIALWWTWVQWAQGASRRVTAST